MDMESKYEADIPDLSKVPSAKKEIRRGYLLKNIYERFYKHDDSFAQSYFSV